MKKVKKQALSLGFSHKEVVFVKQPEWKFMAFIARNAKFKGC